MEMILFFISGLILAFLGALPLGTVNLAVINNSILNKKKAITRISIAAGFSEVAIALLAYLYGKMILKTITNNVVLQYAMVVILFGLAIYFFVKRDQTPKSNRIKISDFAKGLLLGIANPSVWVYWVIAISLLETKVLTQYGYHFSTVHLINFFMAIYLGKIFALLLYGKIGKKINRTKSSYKNTIIGSLLTITATAQLITQLL
ncbi:LysE family transporter [Wenyingzhuangia sp. IMCC45533]